LESVENNQADDCCCRCRRRRARLHSEDEETKKEKWLLAFASGRFVLFTTHVDDEVL